MLITLATVTGFQQEITEKVTGFSGHLEIRKTGATSNYDYPMFAPDENLELKIRELKDFVSINRIASKPAILKAEDELAGVSFKGVDSFYNWAFFEKNLIEGVLPNTDTFTENSILISAYMANTLKVKIGEKLKVFFIKDKVRASAPYISGIYKSGLEEHDKVHAIGDIAVIQRIFAPGTNHITHYEVNLTTPQLSIPYTDSLYQLMDYELDCTSLFDLYPQIFTWLEYLNLNKYIIIILMLFVSGISLVTALLILVLERTQMIGIMKTLGANNYQIKSIFMNYLATILMIGLGIGNALCLSIYYLQEKTGFISLNQDTYYLSKVPFAFDWQMVLLINAGSFVICFLALLIPVQIVSKISPAQTVRFN